jgi:hypothetical protein
MIPTAGPYSSLAIDKEGVVHISYFDGINSSLKYAVGNASSPKPQLFFPLLIKP